MKVTVLVKYDLFPYYIVLRGELEEDFRVNTSIGLYPRQSVYKVLPSSEYEHQKSVHDELVEIHRRKEAQLRVDLLESVDVNFRKLERPKD